MFNSQYFSIWESLNSLFHQTGQLIKNINILLLVEGPFVRIAGIVRNTVTEQQMIKQKDFTQY